MFSVVGDGGLWWAATGFSGQPPALRRRSLQEGGHSGGGGDTCTCK